MQRHILTVLVFWKITVENLAMWKPIRSEIKNTHNWNGNRFGWDLLILILNGKRIHLPYKGSTNFLHLHSYLLSVNVLYNFYWQSRSPCAAIAQEHLETIYIFFFSPKIRVFIRYLLSIIYSGFCRKVLFAYTYKYEALSITRRFYLAILSFFFLSFFCYTNTIYTFILEFCKYKTFVNKRYFIIFNFLRFYTFLFTIFLIPFIQF